MESSYKLGMLKHYTGYGFELFPLFWAEDGHCACKGNGSCKSPGKHPITRNGFYAASSLHSKIEYWHETFPLANWGIRTGKRAGIFVVDVDPGKGGHQHLNNFVMPLTATVTTGSGGSHFYYRIPENVTIRNSASRIASGIDIRGEGGYAIVPPSMHISGNRYQWKIPPKHVPGKFATPSDQLLEAIDKAGEAQKNGFYADLKDDFIEEGLRNDALVSLMGFLAQRRYPPSAIEAAIRAVNDEACDPPMDDEQIDIMLSSGMKWRK